MAKWNDSSYEARSICRGSKAPRAEISVIFSEAKEIRNRVAIIIALLLTIALWSSMIWAWGNDGHEIIAVIAADNLSAAARDHVGKILGVDPSNLPAVADAMSHAAIRPDTEFRMEDRSTAPWHFIDLCLQDKRSDVEKRCPGGNCVAKKIDDYSARLRNESYDQWGSDGDLAFLIHFVGDIHQPLHSATNADRGGNCVHVRSRPSSKELHATWDTGLIQELERKFGVTPGENDGPQNVARKLEQYYKAHPHPDAFSWKTDSVYDLAWESNGIARSEIYTPLNIPLEPCAPDLTSCDASPAEVQNEVINLDSGYVSRETEVAGLQLTKGGYRLAGLLNQIWPRAAPAGWAHGSTPPQQHTSKATVAGSVVGNRRSMIYAWPGCRSYDTMAPHNRVVLASRAAAEAAGYRAARNCP